MNDDEKPAHHEDDYSGLDAINAPVYRRGERPSRHHCPQCQRHLKRLIVDGVYRCTACAAEFDAQQLRDY